MKTTVNLILSLHIALALCVSAAAAKGIRPVGRKIGADKQGNAVYQIRANGIDIAYKLVGTGQPLVMVMGTGGSKNDWPQAVITALSKKYQLILPDNRGMGQTPVGDSAFSFHLFAEDVIGLLDALGVKQAHVLGYSLGSVTVQELLLSNPDRFDKAVIYATAILDGSTVARKATDDPVVKRQMELSGSWRTPLDRMPGIANQVMFVVGTADTIVGVESSKKLAAAIPGAWLVQFKNGTHRLIFEAPADFARIVLAFLDINQTVKVK